MNDEWKTNYINRYWTKNNWITEITKATNKSLSDEKRAILNELLFRFSSYKNAEGKKYIILNVPNDKIPDVCKLLPGMKSPTVTPLVQEGWSSLQSVISEDKFWDIISKLKALGAEGILVVPIEKMIL